MKWSWILLSFAAVFSMGLIDNARGPLYPEILNWFKIQTGQGSLLFSLASLGGLLICWVNKYWLPRLGALRSLQFFIFLQAFAGLGMGLSGYNFAGFSLLAFFSFLFGAGCSGTGICVNILVAQGSQERWRRRSLSGLHAMYGISSLLVPTFIGFWLQSGQQWRSALILLSFFPLMVLLPSFFMKFKKVEVNEDAKEIHHQKKTTAFFGVVLALAVAAELSLSTQIPLFCTNIMNWTVDKASFQLGLFFLFLTIGRLLFSFIHFPGKSYYWLMISALGASLCGLIGLQGHPFFLSFSALFISIFFPCAVDWISTIFNNHIDKLMANCMTIVSLFVVTMHVALGKLTEFVGINNALLLSPLFFLLAFALLLWGHRREWK